MLDWSHIGFSGSILTLGFVGFVGATLFPVRAFQQLRKHALGMRLSFASQAAFALVAVAAVCLALYGIPHLVRVFTCLTDMRCGPNRAGGLISLAAFGAGYLAFEAMAFLANRFTRRPRVAA